MGKKVHSTVKPYADTFSGIVDGLNYEIEEDFRKALHARTITILYTLQKEHAVEIQVDDGTDDALVVDQLKAIENEYQYIRVIELHHHQYVIIDVENIKQVA